MKKTALIFGLLLAFVGIAIKQANAAEITNVKATPSDKYISIEWDALSNSIMSEVEGYAVQWSSRISEMTNIKTGTVRRWNTGTDTTLSSMLTRTIFDAGETYYVRVYTWSKEGYQNRTRTLGNGSKILKFTVTSYGTNITDITYVDASDPVIANTTTVTSSNDSTLLFGKIRVTSYDDFAIFSWSRSKLAKTDASGRSFILSEKADLSDPVIEFTTETSVRSAKIKNLKPKTKYYFKGSFYKMSGGEQKKFGSSETQNITTLRTMTTREKNRVKMLQKRGVLRIPVGEVTKTLDGDNTVVETTDTTTTTTDTSSSTTTSTTDTTTTSTTSTGYTETEILAKIRNLESEILIWRARYKNVTGKTMTPKTAKKITKKVLSRVRMSLRERLAQMRKR